MPPSSTPHAPLGASASFHFGPPGSPAGFAIPANSTPAQDVFVGCRSSRNQPWSLLPFFSPTASGPQPLPKGRFGRFLGWAGDKWMIGPLVFKLATPFHQPTDRRDDEEFRYAPVVCGYLEYDNSHSEETAELVFALDGKSTALAASANLCGFTFGSTHGFATVTGPEVMLRNDGALLGLEAISLAALHFTVPPQSRRIFPLVLGFFHPEFHYARWFADLPAVLEHGLAEHSRYLALSDKRDAELVCSVIAPAAKSEAALAVRQWLAGTQRLMGEPEPSFEPRDQICRAVTG